MARSPRWKRLLHYGTKSRIEPDSPYFLSPTGATDPMAELQSTLQIFRQPEDNLKNGQGPIFCLFPARLKILSQELGFQIPSGPCPELEKWRARFQADELQLVFASQFNANPGSFMGHTFLKFRNHGIEDYLNSTFSYAATIPEDAGPLEYVLRGLFGGFPGVFTDQPYYEKIHEYTNMEQRDVWEYTLKIGEQERALLIDHLWELALNARFDYFFLDENCSYMLLAALEVVEPSQQLLDKLSFYVIPLETIKALQDSELIETVTYRPSLWTRLDHRYQKLSGLQKKEVSEATKSLSAESIKDPEILEVLLDWIDLLRYKQDGKIAPELQAFEKALLLRRARSGRLPALEIVRPADPLGSHGTFHWETGAGQATDQQNFFRLALRPGLHVFMDRDTGFSKNSSFNILQGELQHNDKDHRLYLRQLIFTEIENNSPSEKLDPSLSWGVQVSYQKIETPLCPECSVFSICSKLGVTLEVTPHHNLASFISLEPQSSPDVEKGYRLWPGVLFQWTWRGREKFKISQTESYSQEVSSSAELKRLRSSSQLRIYDIRPHYDLGLEFIADYHFQKRDDFNEGLIKLIHDF